MSELGEGGVETEDARRPLKRDKGPGAGVQQASGHWKSQDLDLSPDPPGGAVVCHRRV